MKVTTGKDEMCPDYTTSSLWQQMIEDQSDARLSTESKSDEPLFS